MSETILRAEAAVLVSRAHPRANFYGFDRLTVANGCSALIQFAGLPRRGFERAALRLLLTQTCAHMSLLNIRANATAFDAQSVSWSTRPEVNGESSALVDGARIGEYVDIDITSLMPAAGDAFFGITLSAKPGDGAAFCAGNAAPIFLVLAGQGRTIGGIYRESVHALSGPDAVHSPAVRLESADRATVFCKNTGEGDIHFSLQISPDAVDFLDDPQSIRLAAGETGALTPYLFSRYLRASARTGAGEVRANITFQMQLRDYRANHIGGTT